MRKRLLFLSPTKLELLFFSLLFLFSFLLMSKTFRVNAQGNLEIATKVWSDFAATIPIIRSFSIGSNFPPEYPLYAGPPIRYHFVFFYVVAFLEKIGLNISYALNGLSALSFFFLLILIYKLAKFVFKKRAVGFISIILFLFNGSFSFIEFFKKNPLSLQTLTQITKNDTFSSFGPYDGKIVSAFWSLNIYTNQRHLALAYAAFFALILIIFKFAQKPKRLTLAMSLLIGIFIGLFPFVHLAVFGMMGLSLLTFFAIYPKLRKHLVIIGVTAFVLSLPQIIYMGTSQADISLINPGYLIENRTLYGFFKYWLFNLGLTAILAPIGFYLSKKGQRKIFIPFLVLFLTGNLFQFSVEMSANHKFFNLFVIGANLFTAYFLVYLWRKKLIAKLAVFVLLFFLTFSGVIDIFPITNDRYVEIKDLGNNNASNYIYKNTSRDSIFLNSSFLYDPANLAGRKIYLGWPYFSWSAGYDTDTRYTNLQEYLLPSDMGKLCSSLYQEQINYVEIQNPTPLEGVAVDYSFFEENFNRIYFDQDDNLSIYDVKSSCKDV
ncbi:MAG: hypothetical protein ACC618_00560 [Patescibacteria group bacterium]